jgi:hypothetical protein
LKASKQIETFLKASKQIETFLKASKQIESRFMKTRKADDYDPVPSKQVF